MKAALEAGFVFWGLFLVFGVLVALYAVWMVREERREGRGGPDPRASGAEDPP